MDGIIGIGLVVLAIYLVYLLVKWVIGLILAGWPIVITGGIVGFAIYLERRRRGAGITLLAWAVALGGLLLVLGQNGFVWSMQPVGQASLAALILTFPAVPFVGALLTGAILGGWWTTTRFLQNVGRPTQAIFLPALVSIAISFPIYGLSALITHVTGWHTSTSDQVLSTPLVSAAVPTPVAPVPSPAPAPSPPAVGELDVTTNPDGAGISVNGRYVGTSPINLQVLAGRPVRVEAAAAGHSSAGKILTVDSGKVRHLALALRRKTASLPAGNNRRGPTGSGDDTKRKAALDKAFGDPASATSSMDTKPNDNEKAVLDEVFK